MNCFDLMPVVTATSVSIRHVILRDKRPSIFPAKRVSPSTIKVIRQENLNPAEPNLIAVSRRNLMLSMSVGILGGFPLLSAKPAEGRSNRQENRRKAMEKLEKNKEKAKTECKKKERELMPFTFPQEQSIGPVVEASRIITR